MCFQFVVVVGDFQIRDNGKGKEKGLGGWKEVVTVVITEE